MTPIKYITSLFNGFLDWAGDFLYRKADWFTWAFIGSMLYVQLRWKLFSHDSFFWDDIYYIWDNALRLCLFILVRCFVSYRHRFAFNIIIIYSIFRLLWEIASPFTNQVENNQPSMVIILNSILITGVMALLWKDLKERAREEI